MKAKGVAAAAEDQEQGGIPPEKNGPARATIPSTEEIQQRAYEIHIERGGGHGWDLDDWLQAERELAATSTAC